MKLRTNAELFGLSGIAYRMLNVNLHCWENVKPDPRLRVSISHWVIQTELWTYNGIIIIISIVWGLKNDLFYCKLCSWNAQQPIADRTGKIFAFQKTLFRASVMKFCLSLRKRTWSENPAHELKINKSWDRDSITKGFRVHPRLWGSWVSLPENMWLSESKLVKLPFSLNGSFWT